MRGTCCNSWNVRPCLFSLVSSFKCSYIWGFGLTSETRETKNDKPHWFKANLDSERHSRDSWYHKKRSNQITGTEIQSHPWDFFKDSEEKDLEITIPGLTFLILKFAFRMQFWRSRVGASYIYLSFLCVTFHFPWHQWKVYLVVCKVVSCSYDAKILHCVCWFTINEFW